MKIIDTKFEGVKIIEPEVFPDERGFFFESYNQKRYAENGIETRFVQDNTGNSKNGTLRGLHYQLPHSQAKLVQAVFGEVFDVIVDIRQNSPTFGQWFGETLSEDNQRQLYIPEGFAHGYCVISKQAVVVYKCSEFYTPDCEKGILWSDPDIGIEWPVKEPILSNKDKKYPCLKDIGPNALFSLAE